MSETTIDAGVLGRAGHHDDQQGGRPDMDGGGHIAGILVFVALLVFGVFWTVRGLMNDMDASGTPALALGAFALLGIALLIALGFEFVNGFHDTANAVATVIYTHSLQPQVAVIYSGTMNFLGVLSSSGAVAFSIVSLLPVELILQVERCAGFAMIFALLIAAIVWNVGTWFLGLPASSSHTLIGSIIGVGIANQLMADGATRTSGWIGRRRWGFFARCCSAAGRLHRFGADASGDEGADQGQALYTAPSTKSAPPLWIRGLLCLTCGRGVVRARVE